MQDQDRRNAFISERTSAGGALVPSDTMIGEADPQAETTKRGLNLTTVNAQRNLRLKKRIYVCLFYMSSVLGNVFDLSLAG